MPKTFTPKDAYVARLTNDGSISINQLDDPNTNIVVVIDFELSDEYHGPLEGIKGIEETYRGIYHDKTDQWEFFGPDDKWFIAAPGNEFYDFGNRTANKFSDRLLKGPCPDRLRERLTQEMTREIREEIDRDIIRDLQIASGQQTTVTTKAGVIVTKINLGGPDRKLKANWTMDAIQDSVFVGVAMHNNESPDPKLKSRMVNS